LTQLFRFFFGQFSVLYLPINTIEELYRKHPRKYILRT
jgi:hypothetical protein